MYSAVYACEVGELYSLYDIILIYIIISPQIHLRNLNHSFEITLFLTKIVIHIF